MTILQPVLVLLKMKYFKNQKIQNTMIMKIWYTDSNKQMMKL